MQKEIVYEDQMQDKAGKTAEMLYKIYEEVKNTSVDDCDFEENLTKEFQSYIFESFYSSQVTGNNYEKG